MQFEVISDIKNFESLEQDWDCIYERGSFTSFQSFSFNFFSWNYVLQHLYGNKLFILKIIDENLIIGFFPLYIDENNRVRFINDVNADFCDIVLSRQIDLSPLFVFILKDCRLNRIQLINLKEDSVLTHFGFNNIKSNVRFSIFERYTELQVDKGVFPDNCKRLLCKERGEIRRIIKKNLNCKHEILNNRECDFPKDDILDLKERMIKNGDRNNNFLPMDQLRLIERLYNNEQLEISWTKDSKIRAILFVLKNKNNSLLWIDLFDTNAYTSTLYNYISYIGSQSLENDICINFGRGDYKWKVVKFRPHIYKLYRLDFFPNKLFYLIHIMTNYIIMIIKLIYRRFK